jgi:ketosteroid isomerase-like protein
MSTNKQIVDKYMMYYTNGNVPGIESTLADDVIWDLPGAFHLEGKKAFIKEATDGFARFGRPLITTSRLTEENNVVIAEGTVESKDENGKSVYIVFSDVFEMKNSKIKRLINYIMSLPK